MRTSGSWFNRFLSHWMAKSKFGFRYRQKAYKYGRQPSARRIRWLSAPTAKGSGGDLRTGASGRKPGVLTRGERLVIRILVLASVSLVVVQLALGLAQDPVKFYLAVAQKVEIPSIDVNAVPGGTVTDDKQSPPPATQTKQYKLTLKAVPAAPVKVWQNGRLLGVLTKGEQEFTVQSGQLQIDGSAVSQYVRVQVTKRDAVLRDPRLNQTIVINRDVQVLRVGP